MADCICIICGKNFTAKRSDAKCCSDDCRNALHRKNYRKDIDYSRALGRKNANAFVERNRGEVNRKRRERRTPVWYEKTCIYCGKTFSTKQSKRVSCGKRDKLHRPNEKERMVDVVCGHCGEIFQKTAGAYKAAVRDGKNQGCCQLHTHILNGSTLSLTCDECGKVFERAKSLSTGKYSFCSKECLNKNLEHVLRGEDHYHYIDGKSSNWRGAGWKPIRRHIRKRDNNTCYLCGITKDELGQELSVHHLVRFEEFEDSAEANDYANLISLCPSCHHSEEINPTISRIVPLIRERRSLINDCLFSKSNKATVYGTVRNERQISLPTYKENYHG